MSAYLGVWETRVGMNGLSEILVPLMSGVKHSLMLSSAASSLIKKSLSRDPSSEFF